MSEEKRRSSDSKSRASGSRRRRTAKSSEATEEKAPEKKAETTAAKKPQKKKVAKKPAQAKAAGEKAEQKRNDAAGESTGEKKSLPAFGFAEDLLKEKKARSGGGEDEGGETYQPASAPVPAGDPERIFAFADRLDEEAEEEEEGTPAQLTTWVAFELAGETFALPVEPIREVLRVSSITRVPHAPQPIRGVTNLRGRVIPVIDLRVRIGLEEASVGRSARVIVVRSRGRLLGLLVDTVRQVTHVDLNKVQPPPEDVMTVQSDYISGVYHQADELILLLDVDRALVVRGPDSDPGAAGAESGAA